MSENATHISCPYCSEEISASAKKCKHCGEFIDAAMREIEALKNQKQSVFMNAGGGASSSSSSAAASGGATEPQLTGWPAIFSLDDKFLGGVRWRHLYHISWWGAGVLMCIAVWNAGHFLTMQIPVSVGN